MPKKLGVRPLPQQVPDPACFPKSFNSYVPTDNTTDPMRGISVDNMRVRFGTMLWMTLTSLVALQEVVHVLDIGMGGSDATSINLAHALAFTYKNKAQGKIKRPMCRMSYGQRCCISFMVTLERDDEAMQRARRVGMHLQLAHVMPISANLLKPKSKQAVVPIESRAHVGAKAALRSPKRIVREDRVATEKTCQRFAFDMVILDAAGTAAQAQLEQVRTVCQPLFIVLHGLPPPPSPLFSALNESSDGQYQLFLSRGATEKQKPQCHLVGCVPDLSAYNWAVFKRTDGMYNRGQYHPHALNQHWRRYAMLIMALPRLTPPPKRKIVKAVNAHSAPARRARKGKKGYFRSPSGFDGVYFKGAAIFFPIVLCGCIFLGRGGHIPQVIKWHSGDFTAGRR